MQAVTSSGKMGYRFLGKTGLKVSEICFGAMTLSFSGKGVWGAPVSTEEESYKLLDLFVAAGGNFIDTADIYGESEAVVGKWLANKNRNDFVIATKVRGIVGTGPNDVGLSRKHIFAAVESSLKALGTSYIDLYQAHTFDNGTPLEETFSAFNDLVRSGKVHYIGVSNFTGWQLQKAIDVCNRYNYAPIVSIQPQYNLLCRTVEWEVLKVAADAGLAVLPWSPLKGGWLSGKYKRPTEESQGPIAGGRIEWAQKVGWKATNYEQNATEDTWRVLDAVSEISAKTGKSHAQIALRWLLQKPVVTCPIIGGRSVENIEDNLGAAGWTLSDEDMAALDKASDIPIPYPYAERWTADRLH